MSEAEGNYSPLAPTNPHQARIIYHADVLAMFRTARVKDEETIALRAYAVK